MAEQTSGTDRLARLTQQERNFLLLYRRGGAEAVIRDLAVKRQDVQPRLAAITATLQADDEPHPNGTAVSGAVAPGLQDKERCAEPADDGQVQHSKTVPDDPAPDSLSEDDAESDTSQATVLDWLARNGSASAPMIAKSQGRKAAHVSAQLRQLERDGLARRTGRTIPGGAGRPAVEWETSTEAPTAGPDAEDEKTQEPPSTEKPEAENWPHTNGVVRRQVVSDQDGEERTTGQVKRARGGHPARGGLLTAREPAPSESPLKVKAPCDRPPVDVEPEEAVLDPRQSPILDWLDEHDRGSATMIAEGLGRKPSNVATRLRQLEQGGFVRRTGRTIPGGRGGPQDEWELCAEGKAPTGPKDVLDSPPSPPADHEQRRRRQAYFEALLGLLRPGAPEHIFERIERLAGLSAP